MRDVDLAACRTLLRDGSRSFYAASHLLPARVRDPATALYAFCRRADDAVDGSADPFAGLAEFTTRLDAAYAGRPHDDPADRAFAATVAQHGIPRAIPEALLDGFRWDAEGRRYETLDDLCAYAVRVAGTVGAMTTLTMGVRDGAALARATDLGVAMQLTNIARDVGEDARNGRLYLPLRWLRDEGIDAEAFLAAPAFTPAVGRVTARLLAAADALYRRAASGLVALPADCRTGIAAALVLYNSIGLEVANRGHDSVSSRAIVSARRKAWLLGRAAGLAFAPPPLDAAPALAQAQFLLDAVADAPALVFVAVPAWWQFGARWVRVLEIFAQMERREQARRV